MNLGTDAESEVSRKSCESLARFVGNAESTSGDQENSVKKGDSDNVSQRFSSFGDPKCLVRLVNRSAI